MRKLEALGVRLTIDDFGIGCASSCYLRSCAFDDIKIEPQCIHNLNVILESRSIVQAIHVLGEALASWSRPRGYET